MEDSRKLKAPWNVNNSEPRIPNITVAIPHHGTRMPRRTLESLYQQTLRPLEIIIASDAVPDSYVPPGSRPVLRQLNTVNNVSAKRNACTALAEGELVAFTDPDCIPERDWLERAAKYFRDEAVVGVEGLVYSDNVKGNLAPRFQPGTYMTANIVYRRSLFERIQFDPILGEPPPHGEDTDFGYRALAYGKIVTAEDARVYHEPKRMSTTQLLGQYILTRSKHVPLSGKWDREFNQVVHNEERQHPLYLVALLYGSIRYRSVPPLPFGLRHVSFRRAFTDRKRLG